MADYSGMDEATLNEKVSVLNTSAALLAMCVCWRSINMQFGGYEPLRGPVLMFSLAGDAMCEHGEKLVAKH